MQYLWIGRLDNKKLVNTASTIGIVTIFAIAAPMLLVQQSEHSK